MSKSRGTKRRDQPVTPEAIPPRYKVGYGKPPVESRFPPGVSGNPKGRPRTVKRMDIYKDIQTLFMREVLVRDGDRSRRVPAVLAFIEKILIDALKGDRKAMSLTYGIAEDFGVLRYKDESHLDLSLLNPEEQQQCSATLELLRKARVWS